MARTTLLNRFLETFVLPLVAGGRVEVRGLLGPGVLVKFTTDPTIDATVVGHITEQMRAQLGRIGPVGPLDLLPPDVIALAAVWHNLLSMTHPEAASRARLRRRVRAWSDAMLEWVGAPRTASEVATRHGVLARLAEVGRVDTEVAFWAGTARYLGVAPPARMVAWKKLRRVRETRTRVAFYELLKLLPHERPDVDLLGVAQLALAYSPLTDIALCDRPGPLPFAWTPASVNALGDTALRGAAQRIVLGRGAGLTTAQGDEAAAGRVRALEAASAGSVGVVPPAGAQLLLVFHLEMLVEEALGRGAPPAGQALAWDAVSRLGPGRTARMLGMATARLERALGLDQQPRGAVKDAPAAALLARAGFSEVPS